MINHSDKYKESLDKMKQNLIDINSNGGGINLMKSNPEKYKDSLESYINFNKNGVLKILVLEAALLIEEHYDEICDELWYIYTREDIRKERLMRSRGYSPEKVQQIFDSQLQEAVYRKHCKVVIDNNGTVEDAIRQIDLAITNMENE